VAFDCAWRGGTSRHSTAHEARRRLFIARNILR
jgi:hypothetical protein